MCEPRFCLGWLTDAGRSVCHLSELLSRVVCVTCRRDAPDGQRVEMRDLLRTRVTTADLHHGLPDGPGGGNVN